MSYHNGITPSDN